MKEIKFRAWDLKNKRMLSVDELLNLWSQYSDEDEKKSPGIKRIPDVRVIHQTYRGDDINLVVGRDCELMQYTGLLRKRRSCRWDNRLGRLRMQNHYGYYMFLGMGDFQFTDLSPDMTSTWDPAAWREKLNELCDLGTNTLLIYLMGHTLPFKSESYPECVEEDHPNVKEDFFQDILSLCEQRNIETIACFSTTGHARSFSAAHSQLAICRRSGEPWVDKGIVCHHREGALDYPTRIIDL